MGIVFCVCLVAANFLEVKVIQFGAVSVTAGLLVFPISYIINDCIVEVWGFSQARLIIWMGFLMNFIVVALGKVASAIPAAPYWEGEAAFNYVFDSSLRIAVASLAAFLIGSFVNAYVMNRLKLASRGRYFSYRAVLSTFAGESMDSIIFFPLAFGSVMPMYELWKMMLVQVLLKTVYEIIILPITITLVRYIKRVEGGLGKILT